MTLVRDTPWDACLLEPRRDAALASQLKREIGRAPAGCFYFSAIPDLPVAVGRLNACLLHPTHVPYELLDLIGLVVSQENSCRYCFAVQRALMFGLGTPRARLDQLERDFMAVPVSARDRAALEFARNVARANPLASAADREPLRAAGFTPEQIDEMLAYIGLCIIFNRLSTLTALPPQRVEALADSRFVRLFRPLIGLQLRRLRSQRPPQPLGPYDGPYAPLLTALDGQRAAVALRGLIDVLWASGGVPPRSLALVCAVVARALGCERGEAECLRLAAAAGLAPLSAQRILDHLGGPELDAFERVALPFARETTWVQAAQVPRIQRCAREVQAQLSEAQFVTLLATTSLANAMCRIGATLPAD